MMTFIARERRSAGTALVPPGRDDTSSGAQAPAAFTTAEARTSNASPLSASRRCAPVTRPRSTSIDSAATWLAAVAPAPAAESTNEKVMRSAFVIW